MTFKQTPSSLTRQINRQIDREIDREIERLSRQLLQILLLKLVDQCWVHTLDIDKVSQVTCFALSFFLSLFLSALLSSRGCAVLRTAQPGSNRRSDCFYSQLQLAILPYSITSSLSLSFSLSIFLPLGKSSFWSSLTNSRLLLLLVIDLRIKTEAVQELDLP